MSSLLVLALLGGVWATDPTPAAIAFPGPPPGAAQAGLNDRLRLCNALLEARWSLKGDRFRLEAFTAQGRTLAAAGEEPFCLILAGGRRLPASELRPRGRIVLRRLAPQPEAPRIADRCAGHQAELTLVSPDAALEAVWQAELRDGSHYVRQQLTVRAVGVACPLEAVCLPEFEAPRAEKAGSVEGSPLVIGPWFAGAEHPMASNGVEAGRAQCRVGSFGPLAPGQSRQVTATVGVLPAGQARRAFLCYLERQRPRPYRPFLHYNSWYDIAWMDRKMDQAGCQAVIDLVGRELVRRRSVVVDSFVFDDGWDDNRTLWGFHGGFPQGFTPLARSAADEGSGIGVWLSPWGGYSKAKEERIKYGRQEGFEMNDRGFSLAGPKYYQRFREACADMVRQYRVNYFKFDGIAAGDSLPGAGPKYAGDIEGLLRLIGDLRQLRPDLFINVTTGTWPSPYWLLWGDSIWRNGEDMGFYGAGPRRQQWITYRDMITFQRIVRRGPLFPISSLMTQGIAHARLGNARLPDDLGDFTAEVRSFFASGTQLQELYITPQLFSPAMWDVLAEAARWSRRNADVLADVHWVGGDPGRGEVYGFAAWSPRQGMLALRNPTLAEGTLEVDLGQAFELPPGAATRYRLVSPWNDGGGRPPAVELQAGRAHPFRLKPLELLVFDAMPAK